VAYRLVVQIPPRTETDSVEATGVVNVPTRNEFCALCVPVVTTPCVPVFGIFIRVPETEDVPVAVSRYRISPVVNPLTP
jgi:hypothetical protein